LTEWRESTTLGQHEVLTQTRALLFWTRAMSNISEIETRAETAFAAAKSSPPAPASRLLASIYRDIGLAAVACGLDMPAETLDADVGIAVKRGARYIHLMPRTKA
jgi:hypothetical protein